MISLTPERKPKRRRRAPAAPAPKLEINLPVRSRFGRGDMYLVLVALIGCGLILFTGTRISPSVEDEVVEWIDEPPPPPPPKVVEVPPPPPPPPPDPQVPPPPPDVEPPPPVFGIAEEATSEAGDMAVATGNTLMMKSDSVVQEAPPPLAPAPVRINQEPEALDKVLPAYPEWAEEQGVTAIVLVLVTIDARGKVTDARIQKSGGKDFDSASLDAARATKYHPFIDNGTAQPARFAVTYEFML